MNIFYEDVDSNLLYEFCMYFFRKQPLSSVSPESDKIVENLNNIFNGLKEKLSCTDMYKGYFAYQCAISVGLFLFGLNIPQISSFLNQIITEEEVGSYCSIIKYL